MRKRPLKYSSELNTKTVRISLGTYQLLCELAEKSGRTIAETLDMLLTGRAPEETITVPRTQIPMPVFTARPIPALSVNGDKHVAIAIKPKGGLING